MSGCVIVTNIGRLCEAGQHTVCPGVYDGKDEGSEAWVCACDCHKWEDGDDYE